MTLSRRAALTLIGSALASPALLRITTSDADAAPPIAPFGSLIRVDGGQSYGQTRPRLAAFPNGSALATWTHEPEGDDESGWACTISAAGDPASRFQALPGVINSLSPVTFSNNRALIVGSSNVGETGYAVLARALPGGSRTLYSGSGGLGQYAVIARGLTSGKALVAWADQRDIGSIFARGMLLGQSANPLTSVLPITSGAETSETVQSIAALTRGGAVVAYRAYTGSKSYTDLLLQRLSPAGSRMGAPIRLHRVPQIRANISADVAGLPGDRFIAAWCVTDASGKPFLKWRIFGPAGVGGPVFSAQNGVDGAVDGMPALATSPDGRTVAVTAAVTLVANARRYNVFGWLIAANGARRGGPVTLYTNTLPFHAPESVITLNSNTLMASFTGGGPDYTHYRAYARKIRIV